MLTPKPRASARLQWAVWITARSWTTGAPEEIGFWTAGYPAQFTAGGVARSFVGIASLLGVDRIKYAAGADVVQTQTLQMGGVTPEVERAFRGYDGKRAKILIFQVWQDIRTDEIISVERVLKGEIDTIDFTIDAADMPQLISTATCQVTVVSTARNGTRVLTLTKSDQSQRLVDTTDAGRQYADTSGSIKATWMGESQNPHRPPGGNRAWDYTRRTND